MQARRSHPRCVWGCMTSRPGLLPSSAFAPFTPSLPVPQRKGDPHTAPQLRSAAACLYSSPARGGARWRRDVMTSGRQRAGRGRRRELGYRGHLLVLLNRVPLSVLLRAVLLFRVLILQIPLLGDPLLSLPSSSSPSASLCHPPPPPPPPWARARRAAGPRTAEARREDGRGRSRARAPARAARAPRARPPASPRGCPRPPPRPERLCLPPAPPAVPLASRACAAAGGAPMKMEPGRPASPSGGPGPDPDPGGPGAPSAPALHLGLGPQDPEAGPEAGRGPGPERRPQRLGRAPDPDPDSDPDPDPDPDPPLSELGPLYSWTAEPEGDGPPSCPHSATARAQDFSRSHHLRGEVDFFPPFPSPEVGEPALELGPGDPDRPSDFSQTRPLTSEPAGCPEDAPRLRAVFEALDGDGDGFVRIADFVQFATVYGAEQVTELTSCLDPSGLGVISFEDFSRGVMAIRNGDPDSQGQLYGVPPAPEEESPACPEEFDDFVTFEATEVTDSAYMGSESTYSECETFTDEDTGALGATEEPGHGATEEPGNGALLLLPGRSYLHSQSVLAVIEGEEHFEDYGEGSEAELSPETLCNGELGCRDPAFLPSRYSSSVLQESGCGVTTLPPPSCLPPEVIFLEKRVSELEKDTAANGEQHSRLRQENLQLVHRANALEEQLKEQELRACEMVLEETRRQKELLCKMEREKTIEIENLQARLQQLDEENSELRSCTPCLKASIERLEEEKQKLLDEIEELSLRLSDEQENRRKLGDRLSHERHQFQRDKEATQELIEDLRKQLEHLQLFKLEAEQRRGRSSSAGLQEYNSRTRESELEQEVRRLKQDNRSLKEQNDELNGQIINLSIQGAKNLFSTAFSESLAAEISSVSRDELMEAIQKQEEINFRLQDYIDRIIVAIMETNPSILEVK
uniref:RAB11 family interacting protein 3 n=1 Tax=Sus scrofa TaxID=9823 RepID=A0A8D1FZU1_PIG